MFFLVFATAFWPISWETPVGYVSPVDCATFLFLFLGLLFVLHRRGIARPSMRLVGLSFTAYLFVVASQWVNGLSDVNVLIKYFVFLVVIPCSLVMSGGGVGVRQIKQVPKLLALSGAFIGSVILVQAGRGNAITAGGAVYIDLFGSLVNKNGMASILLYGVISSAWLAIGDRKLGYWLVWVYQVAITFFIGARSATLVALIMTVAVAIVATPSKRTLVLLQLSAFGVVGSIAAAFLVPSELIGEQMLRMNELANLDASELTAATSRLLLWNFAWEEFLRSPWLGHGYGAFSYSGGNWLDGMYEPHNSVLQILYSGGGLGMLCFLLLLYFGVAKSGAMVYKKLFIMLLFGYFLNSLVGIIWIRGDGHLFWLIFFVMALTPRNCQQMQEVKANGVLDGREMFGSQRGARVA